MTATGCAAGGVQSAALIRAGDAAQEAADQLKDNQVMAATHGLSHPWVSTVEAAIRVI